MTISTIVPSTDTDCILNMALGGLAAPYGRLRQVSFQVATHQSAAKNGQNEQITNTHPKHNVSKVQGTVN